MTASCRCGEKWSGLKLEHCPLPGCHRTFTTTRAGDLHRPLGGPCRSDEELVERGLFKNDRGHWARARLTTPAAQPQSAVNPLSEGITSQQEGDAA